jgi:hypothetical protein
MLADLPQVNRTVDYGCGKLRYVETLLTSTQLLSLVDSEVQLSREQKLRGIQTSIRDVFYGSNQVSVFNTVEFAESQVRYDRAFCINVLSAIPLIEARKRLLSEIRRKLEENAECLFVVQYRNSDFTRMAKLPTAQKWLDGFILKSLRGYSFYALIKPQALRAILECAGFEVLSQQLNEGSVYIWARKAGLEIDYP